MGRWDIGVSAFSRWDIWKQLSRGCTQLLFRGFFIFSSTRNLGAFGINMGMRMTLLQIDLHTLVMITGLVYRRMVYGEGTMRGSSVDQVHATQMIVQFMDKRQFINASYSS